jgi:hypothetical protein
VNKYAVVVTPEAEQGVLEAFAFIQECSSANERKGLRALYRKIGFSIR